MATKNTLLDPGLISRNSEATMTVAQLDPKAPIGSQDFVTDANSTTFAAAAAGGGANQVPVFKTSTGWKVG